MCYTASMLSFLFENLGKTVVLTGSMIPLAFDENDAYNNLICSLLIGIHSLNCINILIIIKFHSIIISWAFQNSRSNYIYEWQIN